VQGEESIIFCEWKRSSYVCPECGKKAKTIHQYHGRRKVLHEIKSDRKRIFQDQEKIRLGIDEHSISGRKKKSF